MIRIYPPGGAMRLGGGNGSGLQLFPPLVVAAPPTVLFRYVPGTTGYTFTRGSIATYTDVNGVVQTAASGVLRDSHYIGGVRTTLTEKQSTNFLLQSGAPATQMVSLASGTYTLWVVGSGSCALSGGPTGTATAGTFKTFTLSATTSVTFTVSGTLTRFQCEQGSYPTSYIATTSATATRAADGLIFSSAGIPCAPQTMYVKYIRLTNSAANANNMIVALGSNSNGAVYQQIKEQNYGSDTLVALSQLGASFGQAVVSPANAVGNLVEVRNALDGTGVTIGESVNNGTEAVSTTAKARSFNPAWQPPFIGIGCDSDGTAQGAAAIESVKIVAGVQTLAYTRTA